MENNNNQTIWQKHVQAMNETAQKKTQQQYDMDRVRDVLNLLADHTTVEICNGVSEELPRPKLITYSDHSWEHPHWKLVLYKNETTTQELRKGTFQGKILVSRRDGAWKSAVVEQGKYWFLVSVPMEQLAAFAAANSGTSDLEDKSEETADWDGLFRGNGNNNLMAIVKWFWEPEEVQEEPSYVVEWED